MPESLHERIADKIVTQLLSIVGDGGTNYWITPDRVLRVHAIEQRLLDSTVPTVYALTPVEEETEEEASHQVRKFLRLDLVLLTQHTMSDHPFEAEAPLRWTLQTRMVRDCEKKLLGDVSLGGLADNLEFELKDFSSEKTYIEKWAAVFCRLLIKYSHDDTSP